MKAVRNPTVSQICDPDRISYLKESIEESQENINTGAVKSAMTMTVKKIGTEATAIMTAMTGGM
jgi:hypothetical protein